MNRAHFCMLSICASILLSRTCLADVPLYTENTVLSYEPKVVRLEGVIYRRRSYGPPNYDKTSPTEYWYSLILRYPVSVIGRKGASAMENMTERRVKEMELVLGYRECKALQDKEIIIDGTLSHAITGHHYTNIILTPITIYTLFQKE